LVGWKSITLDEVCNLGFMDLQLGLDGFLWFFWWDEVYITFGWMDLQTWLDEFHDDVELDGFAFL
jgi:hypothetical protein